MKTKDTNTERDLKLLQEAITIIDKCWMQDVDVNYYKSDNDQTFNFTIKPSAEVINLPYMLICATHLFNTKNVGAFFIHVSFHKGGVLKLSGGAANGLSEQSFLTSLIESIENWFKY